MAKFGNESPDSGYDHFHPMGKSAPHKGRHGPNVAERKAPDSGPGGMSGSSKMGSMPEPGKPMPMGKAIGS